MSIKKFERGEVIRNTIKAYPSHHFLVYDNQVFYNQHSIESGSFSDPFRNVPAGYISLYELNIDSSGAYPFVEKDSSLNNISTVSNTSFRSTFQYGDTITGSYPLSASISRYKYAQGATRPYVSALKNIYDEYKLLSPHYAYSSSLGDKSDQEICIIDIPSIFYGSRIKKKSTALNFYLTGVLIGQLKDDRGDGCLYQTLPSSNSGSIAGCVLYNEGIVSLTGSWALTGTYTWLRFGEGIRGNDEPSAGTYPNTQFGLTFSGSTDVQTITMFATAERTEFNHSNNPTFQTYGQGNQYLTSSTSFQENQYRTVANTVSASYDTPTGSFQKTTYISTVEIYDKDYNLLGTAKLAKPFKKRENNQVTFKITVDL